jgi:archaeal flagellar protein FlaJ
MNPEDKIEYLKLEASKHKFEGYFNLARKLKDAKIVERVSDDILFLLTYMAAISTADIQRDRIFGYAGLQKEYEASKYFKQIYILASKWGYVYAKACKYISQRLKDEYLSKFFGRMSNILSSGEPEKNFLKQEKLTREEVYCNEYERSIESLKKWTDGYTALMVSVTLVVTIILVSVMIYNIENIETIVLLILLLTVFICGIALFIIYKAAPAEKKIHTLNRRSKEQEKIRFLSRILLPMGLISVAVLILMGEKLQFILLAVTLFTLPIGFFAMIDDKNIDERDNSFPAFIKTLGTLAGTTGITIRSSIENLDMETLGCLRPGVEELHAGLSMGFKSKLCWEKFIGETGSELINRCSRIFTDAIELGGDPAEIGDIVSASSLAIVLLRMKRKLVSSGFRGLAITLHAVMIGLLIFIMEIIAKFSGLVSKMSESYNSTQGGASGIGMSMFNVAESVPLLYKFTFSVIIILTISNTLVIKIVEGGGNWKLLFYGGLTSGLSALCIILIPPVVPRVFTFQT